ncbi:MAG: DivIVA domain-containing protein [Mycoplasmataceae bacterium]|jgi:DivIVA domain-containing protein|nr:DivIVA domain-containing protein [Mycoplasmataceae bacterium]
MNNFEALEKEILDKKFRKKLYAGYDPEDVDIFFDKIISYIKDINITISEYRKKNNDNSEKIKELEQKLEQKESIINEINFQLESIKKEGYHMLPFMQEMSNMKKEIKKLSKKETKNKK